MLYFNELVVIGYQQLVKYFCFWGEVNAQSDV